jgi:hypothetical protein
MNTTHAPTSTTGALTAAVRDTAAMTRRNLRHYLRLPALLAVAIAQPVLFVVMFTYVFQGAIDTPGDTRYIDYLMGGIFVLAIAFGSINAGVGLAEDLNAGMIDCFRSLPMARPALLAGRTLADAIRNLAVVGLMIAVGTAIGFRFHAGPLAALGAIALTVALGYVLSWLSALIGLATGDTRAQPASYPSSPSPSPAPPSSPSRPCPAGSRPGPTSTPSRTSSTPTAPSSSAAPPPHPSSTPPPGSPPSPLRSSPSPSTATDTPPPDPR